MVFTGKNALLKHMPPFYICLALIYLPYIFFVQTDLFNISLKHDIPTHILFGIAPVLTIFFGVYFARSLLKVKTINFPRLYQSTPKFRLFITSLLLICCLVQAIQIFIALLGYLDGGFTEARQQAVIEGIGVIIRMHLVLLPIYAAIAANKRPVYYFLGYFLVSHALRGFLMSERVATIEIICLLWVVLPICGHQSLSIKKTFLILAPTFILFSALLSFRLDHQSSLGGRFDSSSTNLFDSTISYYADVTNKYYLVMSGDLNYPSNSFMTPVYALFPKLNPSSNDYGETLAWLDFQSKHISTGLNNPGGLAQDMSDFGNFGLFIVFIKFFILSYCWLNRYRSISYLSISPLILISIIEYPRFNYFYMPFGAYLLVAGVFISLLSRNNTRPRMIDTRL